MFFIDASSIWIKDQELAALGKTSVTKLADSDRDPCLRIDVGTLVDTLRHDRMQGPSILYSSRPPPNDSVWKKLNNLNLQAKIYDYDKNLGTSMATELSCQATELEIRAKYDPTAKEQKANTVFVVITGDRDMLPPIKRILELGIRVELWTWKSVISKEYLKLAHNNDLLEVHFLDRVFSQMAFTHFRSTRKNRRFEPSHTIILCDFVDLDEDCLESYLREMLLRMGQLFFITRPGSETHIFVEFPLFNNTKAMVSDARKILMNSFTVLSWHEYTSRFQKDAPLVAKSSYMHVPLKKAKISRPESTT